MAVTESHLSIQQYMQTLGQQASQAARLMSAASTASKNRALDNLAQMLMDNQSQLAQHNQRDLEAGQARGLDASLLDRLELTTARIESMAQGLQQIASLPDPVGEVTDVASRPSGIQVGKMRVPLGVIGIIFESRPNVTADAAGLCLKSGNAVILRGGSEAIHSNRAIGALIKQALTSANLPQ